jgi:hypothetical protein
MKNPIYISILLFSILLQSCNSDERKIKKFLNRLNHREMNQAAEYIWPLDYGKLYVFNQRFLQNNQLMSLDLEDCNPIENDGNKSYIVKIKCNNCSKATLKYFKEIGKYANGFILDTIDIKIAHENEYISFNWGWDTTLVSENITCSKVLNDELSLRLKPKKKNDIFLTSHVGDEIMVDNEYINPNWKKGFTIDENQNLNIVYFSKELSKFEEIKFFQLSWFDSISIVYVSILAIIVLVIIYPLLFLALARTGASGAFDFAFKLFVLLIIISLVVYQIIERALFEWFIINLPY